MWLIRVLGIISICAAQEHEDVTFAGDVSATTEAPTVYVPPVPSLEQLPAWKDVFPSEEVEFRCNINGSSDWTITWYRDEVKVEDTDKNVHFSADHSVLTITTETQMYSGSYFCQGQHKSKGVTTNSTPLVVTVNANKPKPTLTRKPKSDKIFRRETVTLTCAVAAGSGWEYLWYRNGTQIPEANTGTYTMDSVDRAEIGLYHCKAKRGKGPFFTEDSETTSLYVIDPPTPSLKLLSPWLDVFEGERVEFSCEVDGSDWTYKWYRNQQLIKDNVMIEEFKLDLNGDGSSLNITMVTETNKGTYACQAFHESRNVTSGFSNSSVVILYDKTPTPTVRKHPDLNPMYVGENVTFTCTDIVSSGWHYQWYKNGGDLPSATDKTISIPLKVSDGGKYSCEATRGETTKTNRSAEVQQDVHEIPVPSLKEKTQWLDVFPTESVRLSCGMVGGSDWKYTWLKGGQMVREGPDTVSFDSDGATLSIRSASAANKGQYSCEGRLEGRPVSSSSKSELTLKVYDEKPTVTLTQDPVYSVMFSGESVSFSCHINVSSGWEYLWFKDGKKLSVPGKMYQINSVSIANSGSYTCKAKRGIDSVFETDYSQGILLQVKEKKPKPLMTQKPAKVYAGEAVTFKCKVEISSGWEYLWYKDGTELSDKGSSFEISVASPTDNGTYECMAKRGKSVYQTERSEQILKVSVIPVPSLKQKTQWLDVFPTESVRLSCGIGDGSDWKYTWFKGGQMVQAGQDTVSFDSNGATLSIRSASATHDGKYSCKGRLEGRHVSSTSKSELTLKVYETKPNVTVMQNPNHELIHTDDEVSFSCDNNVSSGWEYLWYKDDKEIATVSGKKYEIGQVGTKNTGSYTCRVKRGGTHVFQSDQGKSVRLNVVERPQAHIDLLTGWSEVFSTDSLVLKCVVLESKDMWNYTWFKGGQQVHHSHSEKYTVTPDNNPEQSHYTCSGNRTGRPSYSKQSEIFKTKNLLLRRRVLLSISGCLFFGLIFVFIGCVVLRVFRKPAGNEDRPEEVDLFFPMSPLKDDTDAPCLVEYLTDKDLKASPKDVDEDNTAVSSETTPLSITTLETQAATTESHNAEESNGGMVSFKQ